MIGNSGCWISPPHMLDIINGSGPGWLNCTTPCRNITDFYFSDQYGYNIHTNDSIRQILGSKVPSCNGENCTISFNISWPFNDQIRNAFNSIRIHCRAIYHLGTGVQVCRTGNISINFMGTCHYTYIKVTIRMHVCCMMNTEATAISSALTTVTSTEIPATSNPMTTHNGTYIIQLLDKTCDQCYTITDANFFSSHKYCSHT